MVLQKSGESALTCKSGSAVALIQHDGAIQVGERHLEGPGEYDIAGIGVHVYDGYAVLFSEGIRVAIFWQPQQNLPQDGESSEIDICIPFLSDLKSVDTIIKEQDPRIVVVSDEALASELATQDGVTPRRENSLKITLQSLPAEDREYVLLV